MQIGQGLAQRQIVGPFIEGGYLPHSSWTSRSVLNWNGDNVLSVQLDNFDQPDVPPGKPAKNLDFTYQGGLY